MNPPLAAAPSFVKVGLPLAKGVLMSALLLAVDVSFIKALIVACVSAIISGVFLMLATSMQAKRAEQIHREVRDVKKVLGADRRQDEDA